MRVFLATALATATTVAASIPAPPATMRAVQTTGTNCTAPDFSCVAAATVPTPVPLSGQVLVRLTSSSVNPDDFDSFPLKAPPFVPGFDVAGVVAELGPICGTPAVGDYVWGFSSVGGMAEYVVRPSGTLGVLPAEAVANGTIDMATVGTLPTVGLTVAGALRAAGAPWTPHDNVTIIIPAGTGGTGYAGLQIAKLLGAAHVVTAATGDGIALAKSLGAEAVADYKVQSVFDLPGYDTSVDVVLNNHYDPTSAAKAVAKLHANPKGGAYVTLEGDLVDKPPANVRQHFFDLFDASAQAHWVEDLDTMAGWLAAGKLRVIVQDSFHIDDFLDAFNTEMQGHVLSKLAIVPAALDDRDNDDNTTEITA